VYFSKELAAIHGYLSGDGYVIKSKNPKYTYYRIGLRNTEISLLTDFQEKFYKVFNAKPIIYLKGGRCQICSKSLYYLLTKKFGSFNSRGWSLPVFNKKSMSFWLRAFFDCES
jgi:hypothetical protein